MDRNYGVAPIPSTETSRAEARRQLRTIWINADISNVKLNSNHY